MSDKIPLRQNPTLLKLLVNQLFLQKETFITSGRAFPDLVLNYIWYFLTFSIYLAKFHVIIMIDSVKNDLGKSY